MAPFRSMTIVFTAIEAFIEMLAILSLRPTINVANAHSKKTYKIGLLREDLVRRLHSPGSQPCRKRHHVPEVWPDGNTQQSSTMENSVNMFLNGVGESGGIAMARNIACLFMMEKEWG